MLPKQLLSMLVLLQENLGYLFLAQELNKNLDLAFLLGQVSQIALVTFRRKPDEHFHGLHVILEARQLQKVFIAKERALDWYNRYNLTAPREAMSGIQEERVTVFSADGQDRVPFVYIAEEWILSGDPNKDNAVHSSHRYETSSDISLFKALLSLCSEESVSAKGAVELCTSKMKIVLSSQQLPLNASMEIICQSYHAMETFVQGLAYAKSLLRKLVGTGDSSSNSERSRNVDDTAGESGSSGFISQNQTNCLNF